MLKGSKEMWYEVIIPKVLCQWLNAGLLDFLCLTILCYHSPSVLHNSSLGLFPNQCIIKLCCICIVVAVNDQVMCKDRVERGGELITTGKLYTHKIVLSLCCKYTYTANSQIWLAGTFYNRVAIPDFITLILKSLFKFYCFNSKS